MFYQLRGQYCSCREFNWELRSGNSSSWGSNDSGFPRHLHMPPSTYILTYIDIYIGKYVHMYVHTASSLPVKCNRTHRTKFHVLVAGLFHYTVASGWSRGPTLVPSLTAPSSWFQNTFTGIVRSWLSPRKVKYCSKSWYLQDSV